MEIKEFILKNIASHPRDIVNLAMAAFNISRPAVHKHIQRLIKTGQISTEGRTRNIRYHLAKPQEPVSGKHFFTIPLSSSLDESTLWAEKIQPLTTHLSANIVAICAYGFTEMVNNAIDHSKGTSLNIYIDFTSTELALHIHDNGIGIFKKITDAFHLENMREAILHLSKGKVTTDPTHHTGEGIFFTSRIFDSVSIRANGLHYLCFDDKDWLINDAKDDADGTHIFMCIDRNSSKLLTDIFRKYADPEHDYTFSRTRVLVQLGLIPGELYLSRSQAKRILWGLDKFKQITLDFKRVDTIGQGFVDEIFRVFKTQHPDITIDYTNANENVAFMIKRSIA